MSFFRRAAISLVGAVIRSVQSFKHEYHVDYFADLHVTGRIADATGNPVEGASIALLDIGLDQIRSRDPMAWVIELGKSQRDGKVSLEQTYTWGRLTGERALPSGGTFEVRVMHQGHREVRLVFDLSTLPRTGRTGYTVDLGEVRLAKV